MPILRYFEAWVSRIQSTLFKTTVFILQLFNVKLNFCCNDLNFKLNWYFCANTKEVVKNFAVIRSVAVKRVDCTKG